MLPAITPDMSFDEASRAVLAYLREELGLGFWSVTRMVEGRQLYLEVLDSAYGLHNGGSHAWDDSLCIHMVAGTGPMVAPDVEAVPAYAGAAVRDAIPIRSYVGVPLRNSDGSLFGALCGLDPQAQDTSFVRHQHLVELLAGLLSVILAADRDRVALRRRVEEAELAASTDPLTGLSNRRAWERFLELEEDRHRRFGDPASVVMVDLDQLKKVNDEQGHQAGDDYIVRAGRALRQAVRQHDVAARLGGDEFALLLRGADTETARRTTSRILRAFDAAGVSGSVGHAPYTIVTGFPGALAEADAAMYAAKRRRRARRRAA